MSGRGGFKHRQIKLNRKRTQKKKKAKANIAQVRGIFEAKGQIWDPKNNPAQMAALNHDARRNVNQPESANY